MSKHLRPRKWPHWMEKKPEYRSKSALGMIYDHMRIQKVEWHPVYDKPFDQRILSRYERDDQDLAKASEIKANYDIAMRRLMGQHEAPVTEFEIWSTFILSKPRVGSDYKLQENAGRDISALKERFRVVCIEAVTGVEQKQSYVAAYSTIDLERLDRFIAAMYTVTYDQVQAALRERSNPQLDAEGELVEVQMPLISFPWLFHRELARVALGCSGYVRPLRKPAWATEQNGQLRHEVQDKVPAAATSEAVGDSNAPEENVPKQAAPNVENQAHVRYEVRSKKEGGSGDADGDDLGEDYVRTSSGNIIHRGEVLNIFTVNEKGAPGSQPVAENTAIEHATIKASATADVSPTLNSPRRTGNTSHTPGRTTTNPEKGHGDDDEEFDEVEFEEVDGGLDGEEEDALEALARKIAM